MTYQVPVWFNVHADSEDSAWELVDATLTQLLEDLRQFGCGEFLVEEPQEFSDEDL